MIGWPALGASYLTALDLCQHFLILSGKDVCRVRMSSCPNCLGFLCLVSLLVPAASVISRFCVKILVSFSGEHLSCVLFGFDFVGRSRQWVMLVLGSGLGLIWLVSIYVFIHSS